MTVITRFAPSPTGFLHIGGARTALFNWLLAKHSAGKFLLRIEDTDRERSTQAAVDAILDGMKWMGLDWDGEAVFQFARVERHAEVAKQLLEGGHAYRCYTSQEELKALREQNLPYDRRWRDSKETPPAGVEPVIRLKAPLDSDIVVRDHIRGEVRIPAGQIEDLVIMRSDGTPTYNLAVVVDDHDMGVTHIVRGEDHLTNAAKQQVIYEAMGWKIPEFAHVPMIHGPDGAKLSKRHGALGVDAYRDMGYLPEAMRNYLLRLGWAHGDDEIISTQQAIEWFTLDGVGKSPSRFDFVKLENLNGHYIREADDSYLLQLILQLIEKTIGRAVDDVAKARLLKGMGGLKARAKTLLELAESAAFYAQARPLTMDQKAKELLEKADKQLLQSLQSLLEKSSDFTGASIEQLCREHAESAGLKLGAIAQPLRAALTGKAVSPPVFEVMEVLGREEALARISDVC